MNELSVFALVVLSMAFLTAFLVIKFREATKHTIEDDIRNLKNRTIQSQHNQINQLNSNERYKTNKPKNDMFSEEDYKRMVKNIHSMYKQGIISQGEYKEQISRLNESTN